MEMAYEEDSNLIYALCFADENSELQVSYENGEYSLDTLSGEPVDYDAFNATTNLYTISGPISFKQYPEFYAALYSLFKRARCSHNSKWVPDGRSKWRIVGDYFVIEIDYRYYVMSPSGLVWFVSSKGVNFEPFVIRTFESIQCERYNARDNTYTRLQRYVMDNIEIAAKLSGNLFVYGKLVVVDVESRQILYNNKPILADGSTLSLTPDRLCICALAYLVEYALKRKARADKNVKESSDEVEQADMEAALIQYMRSLNIKGVTNLALNDMCLEFCRILEVSCDRATRDDVTKFLECALSGR